MDLVRGWFLGRVHKVVWMASQLYFRTTYGWGKCSWRVIVAMTFSDLISTWIHDWWHMGHWVGVIGFGTLGGQDWYLFGRRVRWPVWSCCLTRSWFSRVRIFGGISKHDASGSFTICLGYQLFKTYPRGGDGSKKEVQTMAKVWKS